MSITKSKSDFQFKGGVVTTILLEMSHFEESTFLAAIKLKVSKSPHFFQQAPIIIDLTKMEEELSIAAFFKLVEYLRQFEFNPIGWRCDNKKIPSWHTEVNLPLLPAAKTRSTNRTLNIDTDNEKPLSTDNVNTALFQERRVQPETKVITKPIRSGQQVYSEGDLIVFSSVGAGAEILADGNIHVYGSLRGRALAGVKGNRNARVFCQSLEAELVSIAGYFMLSDGMQENMWKESAHIFLKNDVLEIEKL